MNWVRTYLAEHPELAHCRVRRHRCAVSFESLRGERQTVIGPPAHWWSPADGWQEIDTTLRRSPNGSFGGQGAPARLKPDGESRCGDYRQRTGAVGVLAPSGRFTPLVRLPDGRVHDDRLIREAPGFRHETRVTATGLCEELIVERPVSLDVGEMLAVEYTTSGVLPRGYHFNAPAACVSGLPAPLLQRGRYLALPQPEVPAGVILDPDYSHTSDAGYVMGTSASYATCRTTSTSDSIALYVGQSIPSDYSIYRAFLSFDTSAIPDLDVVLAASLQLAMRDDYSTTDFDVQIVKQAWSTPLSSNAETNYDGCLSGTADASIWRNTSGLSVDTYYASGALDPGWIVKTGSTFYSLRSAEDYNNSAPTTSEFVRFQSEGYETKLPLLTVTHAAARLRMLRGVGW